MNADNKCRECGTSIPPDSVGGFCPQCLLHLGLQAAATPAEAESSTPAASAPPNAEQPGDWIGRYRILQEIGHGGCGVVYLAEQEHPVRRKVALKVIKLGMDTKQVVARFDAERQALALMDHPNIAKILDAGITEAAVASGILPDVAPGFQPGDLGDTSSGARASSPPGAGGKMPPATAGRMPAATLTAGRPYFVMELVGGVKITDYCDQHQLGIRQRLDLFVQVCRAIQHAHQKGVIHRDIKPSNILVADQDGVAVPKVIDFGIAKATQGRLTDQTLFTAFEQFLGTPAYMSPEQTQPGSLDVDTRSDIYSLGVLLYELLTGTTPFDTKELVAAGLDEMRRTIREQEPPTPSTRLKHERQASSSAGTGKSALRAPHSECHRDLDWIVMKCLEKERARRYETANGLATDIERHLTHQPVVAGPPSRLYQFQKFFRRHRLPFLATTAVGLLVMLGVILNTRQTLRATRAEKRSAQVARFLKEMLQGVGPSQALGRDTKMLREILDQTAQRMGKELKDQPEVQIELGTTLADVYGELGLYDQMEAMASQDLKLAEARFGSASPTVAMVLNQLGLAQLYRSRFPQAEVTLRRALTIRRQLLGPEHLDIAESLSSFANALQKLDKYAEAEQVHREAVAMLRRLMGDQSPSVAQELGNLGDLLRTEGKLGEAESLMRECVEILKQAHGPDHPDKAMALHNLALVLSDQGKAADAEVFNRQALEMRRRILGPIHPSVAESLNALAANLLAQSKLEDAADRCREALAMQRQLLGEEHYLIAATLYNLGDILRAQGQSAGAETAYREALAITRKAAGPDSLLESSLLNNLGLLLQAEGRSGEAEANFREVLTNYYRLFGEEHPYVAVALNNLALALDGQGRFADAEPLLRQTLAMTRKLLGETHPQVGNSLANLAINLRNQGQLSAAEAVAREALALEQSRSGDDQPGLAFALNTLANILSDQGRYGDVEPLHRQALGIYLRRLGGSHPKVAASLNNLALALLQEDKLMEAETNAQQALAINREALGEAHPDTLRTVNTLTLVLHKAGKFEEEESVCRDHLQAIRDSSKPDGPELAGALAQLTFTLITSKKYAAAEPIARECLEIRERTAPDHWLTFSTRCLLGTSLLGQQKYVDAEPLLRSGCEGMEQRAQLIPAAGKPRQKEALESLVQLYAATDRRDLAAEWRTKVEAFEKSLAAPPAPAPPPKPPP